MLFVVRLFFSRLWFTTRVNDCLDMRLRDGLRTEHDVTFRALELCVGLARLHFEVHRSTVIYCGGNVTSRTRVYRHPFRFRIQGVYRPNCMTRVAAKIVMNRELVSKCS